METIKKYLKYLVLIVSVTALVVLLWRTNSARVEAERERDSYRAIVLMQEDTLEISQNLYQKKVAEVGELSGLIDQEREESARLRRKIAERDGEIGAYTDLVLTWRAKYESTLHALQDVIESGQCGDGSTPTPSRVRVSFDHDFGPFRVDGYTITSPPEAFVSVSQSRPLRLGVALVQEEDGSWNTVVSSSEDGFEVDVAVSAKHRDLRRVTWRDKVTLDLNAGFLGSPSVGVGAKYGENIAVGPQCQVYADGEAAWSCGLGLSWRPFAR